MIENYDTSKPLAQQIQNLIDHLNALESKPESWSSGAAARSDVATSEKPVVAKERFRAEEGGEYWYIENDYGLPLSDTEDMTTRDNARYHTGNYFCSKKQAEQAAELIKQVLINFHNSL